MTKEEALIELKRDIHNAKVTHHVSEHYEIAIKALEQENTLDKIRAEIEDTLYVDSLIFGEMIDFKNGKISADDVIEEFNRVTRIEVLKIVDKYKESEE